MDINVKELVVSCLARRDQADAARATMALPGDDGTTVGLRATAATLLSTIESDLDVLPEIREQIVQALNREIPKAIIKFGVKQVLFCGDRLHVLNREILLPGVSLDEVVAVLKSIPDIRVTQTWHYVIANFEVPE